MRHAWLSTSRGISAALVVALCSLLALFSSADAAARLSSQPALKIFVQHAGFYRLTYDDLLQAGFALDGVDPSLLALTVGGTETALWVAGEEDAIFDPTDWLLFYGEGLDTLYSDTNVYWLRVGEQPGKRMATRSVTPGNGAPVAKKFTETLHVEVNSYYWQTVPNGEGQEHWFWGDKLNAPASREVEAELPGLIPGFPAALRVHLQGRTSAPLQPHHRTRLRMNSAIVAEQEWSGQVAITLETVLAGGVAQPGTNLLSLEAISITQYASQYFLDWIEFDYQRMYTVTDNQLAFAGPESGDFAFAIDGFASADALVFAVTDPLQPVRLTGVVAEALGDGYRARFDDITSADTRYLALTPDQYRTPTSEIDTPSAWRTASQTADYILITHRDYLTAVLPLVDQRQAQGLRVALVDVTDLYDEFSYGVFTPQAIRDFLAYAWEKWQAPRPRYLLLVGDANIDYRDYLDRNTPNTVPTQLVQTAILGDTPSDNWFVALTGDDPVPEMSIGRLSAQSVADVETIVGKILAYENSTPTLDWGRRVVLVADDDSATFEVMSERLAELLPVGFNAERLYTRQISETQRAARIVAAFDAGALLVNYSGHGTPSQWGSRFALLFGPSQIAELANGQRLPVVTVANCLSGFFAAPLPDISLAERLQRLPNRGAIAVFAPTALNYPAGHEELFKSFYSALFNVEGVTLGEAMDTAKAQLYAQSDFWGELVEMYVLFGDPAMPFRVPTGPLLYLPTVTGGE